MLNSHLGRFYKDGEIIIQQGETGKAMFLILEGQVEVILAHGPDIRRLAILKEGDFFGEMDIFDARGRSATVRAIGPARILTVDRTTLLMRLQEDPSLALHFLETLSNRLRQDNENNDARLVDDGM